METTKKKQEITFRSKISDIYIPNDRFPLHSYCFQNIHKFSTRPCLINGSTGDLYTFADVQIIRLKVAAGLHKLGIQKGDVIMLLVQNSPEFIFAFLGASQIGAICTMANPLLLQEDIVKQAKATNCRLVITQQSCIDKVKDLLANDINGVKVVSIDTAPEGWLHFSELSDSPDGIRDVPKVKIDPEDPVAIFYSSGTTGLPKGAVLTHKALITGVAQQVDGENPHLYLHSEDVIMCVLPLFHVYAFVSVMLIGLRVGSAILLMQKFKITAYMELMERYKVTVAPSVPPILLEITKSPATEIYDFSSVRMVLSAAAPMGKELEGAVRAKFPKATIGQLYGMTEAGSVISMCMSLAKKPFKSKAGSCGTVVRNAEMKIVDPNTGDSLSRNQPGEICIRGQQIMKGYLNNQRATEETIDGDGWLHTGDIGYIDEDDEIYVVDRLKELIKYKGFQIAPAELEAILIAHPHISDAAVVPMKDEAAGEIPVAFIAVKGNRLTISEDDIKLYISKQVVYYKKIHHVFLVDSIPKSSTGKILRKELREKLSRRAKY